MSSDFCLKLLSDFYGTKDATPNLHNVISNGLSDRGLSQNAIDLFLFARKDCIVIACVDACLMFYENDKVLKDLISSLVDDFRLTDEGHLETFLGDNFNQKNHYTLEINQPHLMERVLEKLKLNDDAKMYDASENCMLHKDKDGKRRIQEWNYRSVISMMSYLASRTRPDVLFAVHQCARVSSNPMLSHEEVVKRIGRCLKRTKDKLINFEFDPTKGIEVFAEADFAYSWFDFNSH